MPGISEHDISSEYYESSDINIKSSKADKENSWRKEKPKQSILNSSNLQGRIKSTQKFNQMQIKSIKDIPKSSQKQSSNEFELIRKQYEKFKSHWANLKINEKKLVSDNSVLVQKVQSLSKENNELKHRLSKLINIKESKRNSGSPKRFGSWTAKLKKKWDKNNKRNFESKKHSHVVVSPRMKKVGSDHTLLPINWDINPKFGGRRETLDVNRSSQLLMFGGWEDKSTRNSELVNFIKSENESSHNCCKSPRNKITSISSRNNFVHNNSSGIWNNKFYRSNDDFIPKWDWNENWKISNDYSQYQDQSYNYQNENFRNSQLHSSLVPNCQYLEKELYNQVSNVVSSFFSKFEPQSNHLRQKSKSQIGFLTNADKSWTQGFNWYREQQMWNEKTSKRHWDFNSTERYSMNNWKSWIWDNLQKKINNESCMIISTPRDMMHSNISQIDKMKQHRDKLGSKNRKEFKHNNPVISSHLMGLNKLVRKKNNEVSPIQREETTWLLNSATSLFDTSQSNLQNYEQIVQTSRPGKEVNNNLLLTTEETKESGYNSNEVDVLTLSADDFSQDKTSNIQPNISDEDFKLCEEDIEMERVMKMNFYKFKSQNQNGIVGMCQKVKSK